MLLNPFAPHIAEEIFEKLNFGGMLTEHSWPVYDEAECVEDTIELAVQVNGKLRGKITVPADFTKEDALAAAKSEVSSAVEGKNVVKEIYVPGKLVNLVIK